MTENTFRKSAEAARVAAEATNLPNVRDRLLRSAAALDALADHTEQATARAKVRTEESNVRLAEKPGASEKLKV